MGSGCLTGAVCRCPVTRWPEHRFGHRRLVLVVAPDSRAACRKPVLPKVRRAGKLEAHSPLRAVPRSVVPTAEGDTTKFGIWRPRRILLAAEPVTIRSGKRIAAWVACGRSLPASNRALRTGWRSRPGLAQKTRTEEPGAWLERGRRGVASAALGVSA